MNKAEISIDFEKESLSETLFIPLYIKAKETVLKDPIIKDPKAIEILERVDIDTSRFDGGNITHMGIITRTIILDKAVRCFIEKNPDGIVVNLGAGLDTRITRVDNGRIHWYDLDLPEVIQLRRKFFTETERIRFISGSVFDPTWISEIEADKKPILILAEGLLMYFDEGKVKEIINFLIHNFPKADMFFDVVHSYFVGKGVSAKFVWGIDKPMDIEKLNPRIRIKEHWSVGDFYKKRQDLFFRIMNIFPSIKNRSQVIYISFKEL